MVTPVRMTSAQRQTPESVRTRMVSASAGPGRALVRVVEDDARCLVRHGMRSVAGLFEDASIPAFLSASARAFIQPSVKALSSDGPAML